MKNFLLTILCTVMICCSFAQDKGKFQTSPKDLKMNSAKAVEYLKKNLKLDKKQYAIFMNEFSEYANNMGKAVQKSKKGESSEVRDSKGLHQYMLRFSAKRDNSVKDCLKKKQVALYNDFIHHLHPFTLEVKPPKKRK